VRRPVREQGELAGRMLLKILRGEESDHDVVVPTGRGSESHPPHPSRVRRNVLTRWNVLVPRAAVRPFPPTPGRWCGVVLVGVL